MKKPVKPKSKNSKSTALAVKDEASVGRVMLMPGKAINIYDEGDDTVEKAIAVTRSILGNRKNRTTDGLGVFSEIEKNSARFELSIPALQNLFGARSIPAKAIGDIVGGDGAGKTMMALAIAGQAIEADPSTVLVFLQCGNKQMPDAGFVKRCLSTNRVFAEKVLKRVITDRIVSLDQWFETLLTIVQSLRGVGTDKAKKNGGLPINQPIFLIVDDWSLLASPTEASGVQVYGKSMEPEALEKRRTLEILGAGANFEHAKHAHRVSRTLSALLVDYNVTMIITRAQRAAVSFTTFKGGFPVNPIDEALNNENALGGSAFEDTASWRMITAKGVTRDSKTVMGLSNTSIFARMHSAPHGAQGRKTVFEVPNMYLSDAGDYQTAACSGSMMFLMRAEETGHIGNVTVSESSGLLSCPSLNQYDVTADQLMYTLQYDHPSLLNAVCKSLRIHGYEDSPIERVNVIEVKALKA